MGTTDDNIIYVNIMTEHKLFEINVKNKKHLACCGTIKEVVKDIKAMEDHMNSLQTELAKKHDVPVSVQESIAKHISQVQQKQKELQDKAEICGCI